MVAARAVLILLALSLVKACSPTHRVGHRELTAFEYKKYQAFVAECETFRSEFDGMVTQAIKGRISSDELKREFERRPTHPDFDCGVHRRVVVGPQPRDEDYVALLETRAQTSYEREKAKQKCGEPDAAAILQYFSCASNYVTRWRESDQVPVAPASYINKYKEEELSTTSFEQFKDVEYYSAMKEAEKRLAKFDFLYTVKARATDGLQERLDSIDTRLSDIERRL